VIAAHTSPAAYGDFYRAILGQLIADMVYGDNKFAAFTWLFGTADPVVNDWRDTVCNAADVSLEGLRAAVRAAESTPDLLLKICNALRSAKEQ
jgi:hypothetical protein